MLAAGRALARCATVATTAKAMVTAKAVAVAGRRMTFSSGAGLGMRKRRGAVEGMHDD